MQLSVKNWNETYPDYPPTIKSHGWVYGVWYCGTSFHKSVLHGQYPHGFLDRLLALFPDVRESRILQVPSGTIVRPGITVDMVQDINRRPAIIAAAEALPFQSESFDLVISDPPYSDTDSKKYGTPPYPLAKAMAEGLRVLRPGGYYCLLHLMYPSYSRKNLIALIAVVTGFSKRTRILSIFRKSPTSRLERFGSAPVVGREEGGP